MLSQPKAIVDEYDTFSNMKLAADVILVLSEMPNCEERIGLIKVFMQLDILPVSRFFFQVITNAKVFESERMYRYVRIFFSF